MKNFLNDFEDIILNIRSDVQSVLARENSMNRRRVRPGNGTFKAARNALIDTAALIATFRDADSHDKDAVSIPKHYHLVDFVKKGGVSFTFDGDNVIFRREHFKDAVTESAQFAFNKLIKAYCIQGANTLDPVGKSLELVVWADVKSTYKKSFERADELAEKAIEHSKLPQFGSAIIYGDHWGEPFEVWCFDDPERFYDKQPIDDVLFQAHEQLRANLFRRALDRKEHQQ